jgi:hypothetical protein
VAASREATSCNPGYLAEKSHMQAVRPRKPGMAGNRSSTARVLGKPLARALCSLVAEVIEGWSQREEPGPQLGRAGERSASSC